MCDHVPTNTSLLKLLSSPAPHHVLPLPHLKVPGTEMKPFPALSHIYQHCWQKGSGRAGNAPFSPGTAGPAPSSTVLLPIARERQSRVGTDPVLCEAKEQSGYKSTGRMSQGWAGGWAGEHWAFPSRWAEGNSW